MHTIALTLKINMYSGFKGDDYFISYVRQHMKLSIVIPVYNGSLTIEQLVHEITEHLTGRDFEIILVNDGSNDASEQLCEAMASHDDRITFISLRRNFGEHNAVMCGLNYMRGDVAVTLDDDFQTPPSEIMKLVGELEKGFDVVYSRYVKKYHNWFRNLGSWFNNAVATLLLKKPTTLYLSSFRAIRADIVAEIIKYRGPFPVIDGLILRTTRNISSVIVEHAPRKNGRSNYTFGKLISLWLNTFLNFSIVPLRVFTALGVLMFLVGALFSVFTIVEKLISPSIPLGYASVFVALLLFSGVQIIFLGLIGEYLGKQYLDQNGTPQWVIKKRISRS